MKTFTATFQFKANHRDKAREIFAFMNESFCNQTGVEPIHASLIDKTESDIEMERRLRG